MKNDKVLSLLGLATRAGDVVSGEFMVEKCVKSGKTKAGSQRWLCKTCKSSLTHKIDNNSKELQMFLEWLFGKQAQSEMLGAGRTFRRKTSQFWDIWTLPPIIESLPGI